MQRVNPGTGDAETDGSRDERIAGNWFNPAAFVDPVGIVQGTLPSAIWRTFARRIGTTGTSWPPRRFRLAAGRVRRSVSKC